jgi:[ribosomal protein S5]-alanine N-acetyltransferase
MVELKPIETLHSDKLILRPLTIDDAIHYERLLGDDSASIQMTATIPDPCTETGAREWLTLRLSRGELLFAIEADGAVVGTIGMIEQPGASYVLGYWIGRVHAGKGYASEAVRLIVEYARTLGAAKLLAETFPENYASGRVLTKAGFVLMGTSVHDFPLRGGLRTNYEYELKLQ